MPSMEGPFPGEGPIGMVPGPAGMSGPGGPPMGPGGEGGDGGPPFDHPFDGPAFDTPPVILPHHLGGPMPPFIRGAPFPGRGFMTRGGRGVLPGRGMLIPPRGGYRGGHLPPSGGAGGSARGGPVSAPGAPRGGGVWHGGRGSSFGHAPPVISPDYGFMGTNVAFFSLYFVIFYFILFIYFYLLNYLFYFIFIF